MTDKAQVETLPLWKMIMYGLGSTGWSLGTYAIANLLVYFYMPPDAGGAPIFPARIFQGSVLGVLTVIGMIFAGGRLFDAVTDPIVATWSDRSKSPLGRRRKFMLIAAIPFGICSFLCFVPLIRDVSVVNSIWLALNTVLAYFFMTMYVTPYYAWISELGHNPRERVVISTVLSVCWIVGYVLGSMSVALQSVFEKTMPSSLAFQTALAGFSVVAVVLMFLPVIFIDEGRYCEPHVSEQGILDALKSCVKNRNFLYFVLSDVTNFTAQIFLFSGMVYYITVLLGFEKEFYSVVIMITVAVSFVFYPVTVWTSKKFGKKRVLLSSYVAFALGYVFITLLGMMPMSQMMQIGVMIALFSFAIAVSGILPNAVTADIAEADGITGGEFKAGIFFGARTFAYKMGQMLAALIFPSFLLLGMTVENDLGVRLSAAAGMVVTIIGGGLLLKYNEKEILGILATREDVTGEVRERHKEER
ncbi:MAG: MFS transporter [Deltaproteobacteria bacterium]|nr:MFS transporter [Candidatus Zymogenaceae bacterium]